MVKFVANLRIVYAMEIKTKYCMLINKMKYLAAGVLVALSTAVILPAYSQTYTGQIKTDRYITLPMIPDSITTLQGRTDYLVSHYWDFCDMKKIFSSRTKMAEEFKNYLMLMPHASQRGAHRAVASLLRKLDKQPDDMLFLARKAEEFVHSDTSEIYSDELYLPFAVAVAGNKRIDKAVREPYEHQARILAATQKGAPAPAFEYTDRQGNTGVYEPDTTVSLTVIFFNDPDCMDCTLARARLNSNIKATDYVKEGIMRIVAVSPTAADASWQRMAEGYPEEWQVLAAPDVDDIYDIRTTPSFYVLDHEGKIVLKNIDIEQLVKMMEII